MNKRMTSAIAKIFITCKSVFLLVILFLSAKSFATQQYLYGIDNMPCVDVHTHLNNREAFQQCIRTMDMWGGTISINLSGTREMVDDLDFIRDSLHNRILIAPRASTPDKKTVPLNLWWTEKDVKEFKKRGIAGFKIPTAFIFLTKSFNLDKALVAQEKAGMPCIGMHIGKKPEDYKNEMDYVKDAVTVIEKYPKLTFIMAHGFWLMNNDSCLDTLAKFFDKYPNLNVDLASPSQYWGPSGINYTKLRNFIIKYKDRMLFGTDYNPRGSVAQFIWERQKFETDSDSTLGFFQEYYDSTRQRVYTTPGLNLPLDVLNHIYYWNAARLIPQVKEVLQELGYQIGDEPPVLPVKAEPWFGLTSGEWNIVNIFSIPVEYNYHIEIVPPAEIRGKKANVIILSSKGEQVKSVYNDTIEDVRVFSWDGADKNGKKAGPGYYQAQIIMDGKKLAEKMFFVK